MEKKINGKTTFITVRHGYYDEDGNLSSSGQDQMKKVAKQIKELNVDGLPISIICSTAPRAQQGGKIIAEELGISEECTIFNECLWLDSYHRTKWDEVKKFVEDNIREDTIILGISHLDLVPAMASHVAEMFGHSKRLGDPSYGSGYLVNSEGCSLFPR